MGLISKLTTKIKNFLEVKGNKYHTFVRNKRVNNKNRKRLLNKNFSLICNDCTGAVISHDLGVKFYSPTVNLWLEPKDFIKYCQNIEYYNSLSLNFDIRLGGGTHYPVGRLDDIKIHFMHYQDSEHATIKWEERKKRINFENLFLMLNDRNGLTEQDALDFDSLPYKNKVLLTRNKNWANKIKCAYYIKGFEKREQVDVMSNYKNCLSAKRHVDQFDYVRWLNEGK